MSFSVGVFLVLLVSNFAISSEALYFYLEGGKKQCFVHDVVVSLEVQKETLEIHYNTMDRHGEVWLSVFDEKKSIVQSHQVDQSKANIFSVPVTNSGQYQACFLLNGTANTIGMWVIIESSYQRFDQTDGQADYFLASDWDTYVNKMDSITQRTLQVSAFGPDMLERQMEFEGTVHSTHWRVIGFVLVLGSIVLSATVLQTLYLRQLFKQKKIV